MKKISTLFLLFLIGITSLFCSPIDTNLSKRIATHFYASRVRGESSAIARLAYTIKAKSIHFRDSVTCFRIYNVSNGFVIVSANDCLTPVIGYSTEGNFDASNIPVQMKDWLDGYASDAVEAIAAGITSDAEAATKWRMLSDEHFEATRFGTPVVGPLLSTTWDQNSPYNIFCPADAQGPEGHTYAGCVATAMGQIIRYWEYPTHGIGQHSYNANFSDEGYGDYGTQSVNFGNATYNYSLMPNSISSSSSQEQISEVAKLLYHCGVSVDMKYGYDGSGAITSYSATALTTYFGYPGCTHKNRMLVSENNWKNYLKTDLNNLQPIIYYGSGTGGHAFVCDGYDSENYFHFNWGWSGSYNGYFLLDALTPGTSHNYSSSQGIIIGINGGRSIIRPSRHSISFLINSDSVSAGEEVSILTCHLTQSIHITATGNFAISTDNSNYSSSCNISSSGGHFFIRYQPLPGIQSDHGCVILSSGSIFDTITLVGNTYQEECLPPENLIATSANLQNITITWDEPTVDPMSRTLTWNESSYISTNYGYGSDYKISMMQRFCDSDLISSHGLFLTEIEFTPKTEATLYKAIVYRGGSFDGISYNPGILVLEQPIALNTLTFGRRNKITLNTPVQIDAHEELWFGIYVEAPGGSYVLCVTEPNTPTKGCIYGNHSGSTISWNEFLTTYNFAISGTVENIRSLQHYDIFRDNQHLGSTTDTYFQDYLSDNQTHTYSVSAIWDNNCSAFSQTTYTNVPQLQVFPSELNFFSNFGHNQLAKSIIANGIGLSEHILAQASGNFTISNDSIHFSSSIVLPTHGGKIYVRYNPLSNDAPFETGRIELTSDSYTTVVSLSGQCYGDCNPPKNLILNHDNNLVHMSWDSPDTPLITSQEISWCSDYSFSYGSSSYQTKAYLMHRYTVEDLEAYYGKQLTAISFIPSPSATAYKVVAFKGGQVSGNNYTAGTMVVEQNLNIQQLTPGIWNTITLDNPIDIYADEEIWYGIYIESPQSTYSIYVGGPYVQGKGCIYKNMRSNYYSWTEFSNEYSFVLKATIENKTLELSEYQIYRDNDSINRTTNTNLIDNFNEIGTFNYAVFAIWDNGCKAFTQNTITICSCTHHGESQVVTACDSYTWFQNTYSTSGTYYYPHLDSDGCPITDTLHLTINNSIATEFSATACDAYTWNGQTYTASGDYTQTLQTANDCDSTVTLHLTINNSVATEFTATACNEYVWNGQNYTTSGDYTQTLPTVNGCDSTVTLHLTVNNSKTSEFSETACDAYTWNGQTYTASGDYIQTLPTANGCDSTVTLHLTINYSDTTELYIDCADSCYYWNNEYLCETGDYSFTTSNIQGCDSLVILHLTITNGINEHTSFDLDLYPNPTSQFLHIKSSESTILRYMLYDVYGQLLQSDEVMSTFTSLNMTNYPTGTYLIKVQTNRGTFTSKILKQ